MSKYVVIGDSPAANNRVDLEPLEAGMKTGGQGDVFFLDNQTCIKILRDSNSISHIKPVLSLYRKVENLGTPPKKLVWSGQSVAGYTMERLDNWNGLNEILTKSDSEKLGIDLKSAGIILIALCRVIREIHKHGFVIGDLNPSNVLFKRLDNNRFLVKIIDVDSWSVYRADLGIDFASKVLDTGAIFHPDLIRAERSGRQWPRFTPHHDWWAFAYLCWMVLAKHDPFVIGKTDDKDREDRILEKCTANSALTVKLNPKFGPTLQALGPKLRLYLDRCLKEKVRNRPFPTNVLTEFAYNLRKCRCGFTAHASAMTCPNCAKFLDA